MYWNEVKIVTTPIVVIVQLGKTFIASNDFWTFCGSFLLDPSKTINPQENIQINQIISYMVWSRLFIHITLKLSGPRQRVRLNDLLCEPLLLTLSFCFDLFGTETAEHHCSVCTMPTTDFETNQNLVFLKPNRTAHHVKQTNWHYHQFHLPQKPPTETTTPKNNPRNLIFTKPGTNRSGFSFFDLLGFA